MEKFKIVRGKLPGDKGQKSMKEILEKSITTENSRTKRVAILMPQVFSVMETRGMGNLKKKAIQYDSYCIAFFL